MLNCGYLHHWHTHLFFFILLLQSTDYADCVECDMAGKLDSTKSKQFY